MTNLNISIDVFSETNPAFCSIIIFNFLKGYCDEVEEGVPFPIAVLPLPIILSNDLSKTFDGTNAKTGFFRWIENNPMILLGLSERIIESAEFLKPAIEYGLYKKIYQINELGNLIAIENSIKASKNFEFDYLFKYAGRLGTWIGQVNSTKTIYNHLGLKV
jgi:hypothetical protein